MFIKTQTVTVSNVLLFWSAKYVFIFANLYCTMLLEIQPSYIFSVADTPRSRIFPSKPIADIVRPKYMESVLGESQY